MSLESLSVLIITHNEAANIERCLQSVSWAPRIIVLDSFSSDNTLELARKFPQVEVLQHEFVSFADQCNYGLEQIQSEWTLSMDADYIMPAGSDQAIVAAMAGSAHALMAGFEYWVHGKAVHGSILPGRTVLYRTAKARYENDGHGHRVQVSGEQGSLPFLIAHDDRKPLSRWLNSQLKYAHQEADKLLSQPRRSLGRNDRIRRWIFLAPPLVFLMVYVLRGGFLSGWRGFYYAMQRMTAETLLSLNLLERKLGWQPEQKNKENSD